VPSGPIAGAFHAPPPMISLPTGSITDLNDHNVLPVFSSSA
jgi:hypothetical protein